MVREFEFPDVGEGVTEGTLLKWLVSEGDTVAEDESLAEVETDKAVVEVPSPVDGTVQELHAEEGDVIKVGNVLVTLAEEGDAAGGEPEETGEQVAEGGDEAADDGSGEGEATADDPGEEADGAAAHDDGYEDDHIDYRTLVEEGTVDEVRHRVEDEDIDPGKVLAAERATKERATLISWLEDRIAAEEEQSGNAIVGQLDEGGAETEDAEESQEEVDEAGEAEPSGTPARAPPSVRQLAREEGVDIDTVDGSGPGGRITESDVRAAAGGGTDDEGEPAAKDEGSGSDEMEPAGDTGTVLATPATRRIAREEGVDIHTVQGSGPDGRVTEEDVRAAAGGETEATEEAEPAEPAAGETPEGVGETRKAVPEEEMGPAGGWDTFGSSGRRFKPEEFDFEQYGEVEREELSGTRRAIARRMERSKYTAPHVTSMDEADVTELWEMREKEKQAAAEKDVHLTFMPFIIKAVISALRDYPRLNASLDETTGELIKKHYYNIGVAVATDDGLLVPNIKDADQKSVLALARAVNEKAEKARERELSLQEMRGGTFTITNWGSIGGSYGTPIMNYPEVGILGTGVIEEKPVVRDGEIEVRKVLPLSLSFDHRVVDGAYAAQFLNELVLHLEDPDLLLIDE